MTKTVVVLAVTLFAACAKESPVVQVSPPQPQTTAPRVVEAAKAPATAVDPLRAEYERATLVARDWDGDRKKLDEARAVFMSLLEKNRDYAPAYVGLARVERSNGYINGHFNYEPEALQRAWKIVNHALKLDPESFDAHALASRISVDRADIDLARTHLDAAAGVKPSDYEVHYDAGQQISASNLIADVHVIRSEMNAANAEYQRQLQLMPRSAWVHGNYASFLLDRGSIDDAVREAETAVKIRAYPLGVTTLVRAYAAKADALWLARRFDESATYVERIAAIAGTDNPQVCYALGVLLERAATRSGDPALRERAVRAYRRALELAPDLDAAAKALKRLNGQA